MRGPDLACCQPMRAHARGRMPEIDRVNGAIRHLPAETASSFCRVAPRSDRSRRSAQMQEMQHNLGQGCGFVSLTSGCTCGSDA
eukprot:959717-Rhodomonas_salina.2